MHFLGKRCEQHARPPGAVCRGNARNGSAQQGGDAFGMEVQTAADDYTKLMRAANKAKERANGAKEACLDAMDRCKVKRVRIDDGAKWL